MNSTSLSYFSTPKKQPAEQGVPLYVNGNSITSLHELRTHTKPNDLYPLLHNHSLLHWLTRANFGASIRIPSFLSSKLSENQ